MSFETNLSAFCTITTGAIGTAASTMAVCSSLSSSNSLQKTAAYGALAFGTMTGTLSAVTAWFDPTSKDVKSYMKNVSTHFCYGVPAMATAIANTVFDAAVQGIAEAVHNIIEYKITGAFLGCNTILSNVRAQKHF
jgi:hypothetical protein